MMVRGGRRILRMMWSISMLFAREHLPTWPLPVIKRKQKKNVDWFLRLSRGSRPLIGSPILQDKTLCQWNMRELLEFNTFFRQH